MQHKTRLQMSLSKFFELNSCLTSPGVIDMDRTSFAAAVIAVILVSFQFQFS